MSPQFTPLSVGVFFVFIFLSGFGLRFSAKPYNNLLLTAHKLVALAAGLYLGWALYHLHQAAPLSAAALTSGLLTLFFILTLVVTGGLLSLPKPMPTFISNLHLIAPFLTILSTAAVLFLLQ